MDTQIDRPYRAYQWAIDTFGVAVATNPTERAMRLVEEAIELGHAMGLNLAITTNIVRRVYSGEMGNVPREVGQVQMTLEVLAKSIGVDADAEATKEFQRVQGIPKSEWDRRHGAKVKLGIAT